MTQSHDRLARVWRRRTLLGAPALTLVLAAGLSFGAMAQDATPDAGAPVAHPAHIHDGGCGDELGSVVAPLTELSAPTGAETGSTEAEVAATSFTSVPMTLETILASDHAINVHRSAEQIDDYIACGEIGGVLDANGAIAIGLDEVNDSGFTGIAYLSPGADGASTDVSVFVAQTGDVEETTAVGGETTDATVTAEAEETVTVDTDVAVTEDTDATATVEADDAVTEDDDEVTVDTDDAVTDDDDATVTEDDDTATTDGAVATDDTAAAGDVAATDDDDATVEADADATVAADLDIDLNDEGTPEAGDDDGIDVTTDTDDADLTDADMTATAEADDDQ